MVNGLTCYQDTCDSGLEHGVDETTTATTATSVTTGGIPNDDIDRISGRHRTLCNRQLEGQSSAC